MYISKVKRAILAIFIFMVLFTISAVAIGDNSACANNQCHGDIVSKYSTTSHNLCTDCHNETSTYPHTEAPISEPGDCSSCHTNEVSNFNSSKHGYMKCSSCHDVHGDSTIYKSLRKNLEVPLISNYYSNTDFEICYMCHSEANLMQMPDPDETALAYQSTFGIPVFSGPFATDFRKMTSAWWDVDLSLPGLQSNLHYDHISRFRGSGTAQWDPEGGNNKSFESCITCHNPHGSASPRLTVTNLSFEWDFSAGDNVGGNISGFEVDYCNSCHLGGAYSRDNLTTNTAISVGGPDCIGCHGLGAQYERINESAVAIGIHANLNTTSNPNSRCWACHDSNGTEPPSGTHPDRVLNPYSCERCHSISSPQYLMPPQVIEHIPYGDDVKTNVSCVVCHIKSIENYGTLDSNTTVGSIYEIAHYGKKRTDLYISNETDCAYCHQNTSEFSDVFVKATNTDITHNGNQSCYFCHREESSTSGRIHDSDLTGGGGGACNNCHGSGGIAILVDEVDLGGHININITIGGVDNLTDEDCMGCHFDNPHPGPDATNTYYCIDCHTSAVTTSPIKSNILFTDRQHGEVTCADCHLADTTYHQNNPRGAVANSTYVYRYVSGNTTVTNCADCHYAANLDDGPFNAPGGGEHILTRGAGIGACATGGCHSTGATTMVKTMHNLNPMDNTDTPSITLPLLSATTVIQGVDVTVITTISSTGTYSYADGAQYRIMNGTEVVTWTPMSAVDDGNFNTPSEDATATISTTTLSVGTYTVEVRGMAGGPANNTSIRYYPMNGDVSVIQTTTLTVEPPMGYINGTVTSGESPLAGAIVSTTGASTTTAVDGTYSLSVAAGTYDVTASKAPAYTDNTTIGVTVTSDATTIENFVISLNPTGSITGTVTNSTA